MARVLVFPFRVDQSPRARFARAMKKPTPPPQAAPTSERSPVWDFAAALNPKGGALGDALPFTLTGERMKPTPAPIHPGLFDEDVTE